MIIYLEIDNILHNIRRIMNIACGGINLKNCKLCRYSEICNSLPGICILMQYLAVALLIGMLGYLFITQEFMH